MRMIDDDNEADNEDLMMMQMFLYIRYYLGAKLRIMG